MARGQARGCDDGQAASDAGPAPAPQQSCHRRGCVTKCLTFVTRGRIGAERKRMTLSSGRPETVFASGPLGGAISRSPCVAKRRPRIALRCLESRIAGCRSSGRPTGESIERIPQRIPARKDGRKLPGMSVLGESFPIRAKVPRGTKEIPRASFVPSFLPSARPRIAPATGDAGEGDSVGIWYQRSAPPPYSDYGCGWRVSNRPFSPCNQRRFGLGYGPAVSELKKICR